LETNEIALTNSDRARILLHELPYFESQRPSLFVLLGNKAKAIALKELASSTDKKTVAKRGCGEIHLHIDPSTTFSDRPILFADRDIADHQRLTKFASSDKCHEVTKRTLPALRASISSVGLQPAADRLYSTLLTPFTDVFCFFADDLGGLETVAHRIASWIDTSRLATFPATALPQIVIVIECSASEHESQAQERFFGLLASETRRDVSTYFAGIRVLALLPSSDVSAQARHRRLRECLMAASDQVRSVRADSLMLFCTQHLAAFLDHACSYIAEASSEPFNFIRTARLDHPPATDLKDHLTNFLQQVKTLEEMRSFAVPLVASSLLLDNYPPDMHREWDHSSRVEC
jgi:hypothetical protein